MAPRPLADLIDQALAPALAAQGFAGRAVLAYWPEIVGERLARRSRPLRIEWPRRRPAPGEAAEPATLVVRVEGAFALDLQQVGSLVLERVNTHLGWRAVGRMVLKQGPVDAAPPAATRARVRDPERAAEVAKKVAAVADPGLRQALQRLGEAIGGRTKA